MALVNKDTLKSWFLRGMKPLSGQFADWLDSYWHKHEKISISSIDKLETILSCKAENNDMQVHRQDNRNPHRVDKAQVGLGNADNTADRDKPVSTAVQSAINEVQTNLDNHNEDETAHADIRELVENTKTADTGECRVTFTEAAEKAHLVSGETHAALFGKIQKWLADLKAVAFSGKASDLTEDTTHRFTTDAEKANWADKYTVAQTNEKDTITLQAAKEHTAQKIAELVNGSPEALDTLMELSEALGNDPNFATTVMNTIGTKADKTTITSIQTALDRKADSTHNHTIANVANLQNELNGKLSITREEHYIGVRTPGREPGQFYEFWDGTSGYADIHAGEFYANKKKVWHTGNFNPDNVAAANHAHTVMKQEDIFVGGSRGMYYPVVIPIKIQGINRFVITRSIHEDANYTGSLRAAFEVTKSEWGNYIGMVKCMYLLSSSPLFIAGAEADSSANMKGCVLYLKGNTTYHIGYYYDPYETTDIYLVTTDIGRDGYPVIVSPTAIVSSEFSDNIFPINSYNLLSQLNLKANAADLKTVAFTGDYNDLANTPDASLQYIGGGTISKGGNYLTAAERCICQVGFKNYVATLYNGSNAPLTLDITLNETVSREMYLRTPTTTTDVLRAKRLLFEGPCEIRIISTVGNHVAFFTNNTARVLS